MGSGGRNAGFFVAVAACAALLFGAAPAWAQDLHVNSSGDDGDTTCDDNCTLRDAVGQAVPGDTIVIDAGVDPVLAWSGGGPITLSQNNVTLRGRGANRTVIGTTATNAQPFRVFEVTGSNVTIADVKITGGIAPHDVASATSRSGGGIRASGALTLQRVWIDGNSAGEGSVGGGGAPGGGGGGVASTAPLVVEGSTISGNFAGEGSGFDDGGDGGGILATAGLAATNTTITGNKAGDGGPAGDGGGIAVAAVNAEIVNVTLAGNRSGGSLGPAGQGGGMFAGTGSTVVVRNSIFVKGFDVAGNCGGAGSVVDGGGNISFGGGANGCPAGFATGDPLLDPDGLVFNGGPTPTLALLPGSAAIDAAVPLGGTCLAADGTSALTTDQRGLPRPSGHGCDSGAFELQVPPGPPPGGGGPGALPPSASPSAGGNKRAKKKKKKKCQGSFKPKKRKGRKPKLVCVKVHRG